MYIDYLYRGDGMYEYKVVKAKNERDAEEKMNTYAKEGWRVISTALWSKIIITFERKINN
jgi:Domain of unknown function (DUF4177)